MWLVWRHVWDVFPNKNFSNKSLPEAEETSLLKSPSVSAIQHRMDLEVDFTQGVLGCLEYQWQI